MATPAPLTAVEKLVVLSTSPHVSEIMRTTIGKVIAEHRELVTALKGAMPYVRAFADPSMGAPAAVNALEIARVALTNAEET